MQTNFDADFSVEENISRLAEGFNAIDLSGSYSLFSFPELAEGTVEGYLKLGAGHALADGAFELRKSLSEYISKKYFRNYSPVNEIVITAGAVQSVFTAIAATVKEGDEVIIFEPIHESLATAIKICGARPIFIKIKDDESIIDWAAVQKAITPNTKLIVICTPHGLLGRVFTSDDLDNLQKLINGTKIKVISDESLSEIVYSDTITSSVTFYPKLADNSYIIGSLSQSMGVPGWEVGYCVAPKELMDRFRKVHRAVVSSVSHPVQLAIEDCLSKNKILSVNMEPLEQNKNSFCRIISNSKFKILPISGGYFQVLSYSAITSTKDTEFVEMLVREHGVAVAPMSVFHHDRLCRQQVRVNLAVPPELLVEGAYRLAKL
ncbi:MAG: aminotransferase class I/II-fold pyridoxal phosphate-dependent enzyme [Bacteroidales bacterium]